MLIYISKLPKPYRSSRRWVQNVHARWLLHTYILLIYGPRATVLQARVVKLLKGISWPGHHGMFMMLDQSTRGRGSGLGTQLLAINLNILIDTACINWCNQSKDIFFLIKKVHNYDTKTKRFLYFSIKNLSYKWRTNRRCPTLLLPGTYPIPIQTAASHSFHFLRPANKPFKPIAFTNQWQRSKK